MAPDKDVLRKIAGLLRLSQDNTNVNEAATAAAAAQALLTKHRLSEADLSGVGQDTEAEVVGVSPEVVKIMRKRQTWLVGLASAVALVNGCRIFTSRTTRDVRIRVVGRKSDTEIVNYFVRYLASEIDRLATNAAKAGQLHGKTGANSFRLGAVAAIRDRLNDAYRKEREAERARAKAAGRTSTALVKLDTNDQAVTKFYDGLKLRSAPAVRYNVRKDAFGLGQEAGKRIALNKALDGREAPGLPDAHSPAVRDVMKGFG